MNIFFVLIAILKIIGIILGLLLLLIVIVLVSPVFYRATIQNGSQNLTVHYLYPLLSYHYIIDGKETISYLQILFFKKKQPAKEETVASEAAKEETAKTEKKSMQNEATKKEKEKFAEEKKPKSKKPHTESDESTDKKANIFSSAKSSLNQFNQISEKKKIISKTIWLFKKLLKHIWPDKISGYCHIGLENPAYTGFVLSVAYPIIGLTNSALVLNGNFEEKELEYNVKIKGKIILGYIAVIAARYTLYKPIWNAIKIIRKKEDQNVN